MSDAPRVATGIQRAFYERAYAPTATAPTAGEALGWLQRFEVHRVTAVTNRLRGGERLLDVGCGDGGLLRTAASKFERVVGCDISAAQLARGRHADPHALLALANIDQGLPFPDNTFDAVACIAVLAMVYDPYRALAEIHRVLRPGGQLVIEVPNLAYLPRRLALLRGEVPWVSHGHGWDGGHLHNFTRGPLLALLRTSGFETIRLTGSGVFAALRAWWPALLTGNLIVDVRRQP